MLALWACGDTRPPPHEQPAAPASSQMRVMSYNVNFGIAGDRSTIEAIAAARADIVLLQETNERWQLAIAERLGEQYPFRQFADPIGWPAGGMGLLSKFPIVTIDQLAPPPGAPFFAWRIVLDTKLGRVQLLDVHLRPPMSDSGSWVVGFFSTRDDRLREAEYHHASLDPKLPTIIAGDFNEEADGKAIGFFRDHGFTDAIATFAGTRRTWEWPVGSITLRFQLDHILHDDHFVPVTASIVEAGRSDHKPVWADFERIDP